MPSRSRRSRSFKSPRSRRLARRPSKFRRRRPSGSGGRTTRRFGFRKFGGGGHRNLSRQVIKSFFPDVAKSKLIGHHIWTGIPCNDLSSALALQQGGTTSNTISIHLNGNPNNGSFYVQPGTDTWATDRLNPVDTYITRYKVYRPIGCKVDITVFSQDNGEVAPDGSVSNIQVATPFMLYGFPCVFDPLDANVADYGNEWDGTPGSGFTADTIPQMKYGFRRISPGLGGKNVIKYSTYWDFAKIAGLTKEQYLSFPYFTCNAGEDGNSPLVSFMLVLALADYTPAVARQCTVDIKITQYGRWEGQELTFQ